MFRLCMKIQLTTGWHPGIYAHTSLMLCNHERNQLDAKLHIVDVPLHWLFDNKLVVAFTQQYEYIISAFYNQ